MKKIFIIIILIFICFTCVSNNDDDNVSNSDMIVYITNTGSKYHREDCSYLQYSKIEISLEEAINSGYEPCSRCNPPTF